MSALCELATLHLQIKVQVHWSKTTTLVGIIDHRQHETETVLHCDKKGVSIALMDLNQYCADPSSNKD